MPFDAPEITAAAFELGASHAPGQSLHAFLGHFATWLPLGPVTWRLGLFSAALATLAACAAAGLTRRLLAWFDAAPSPARTAAPYAVAAATLLGPTLLRQALRVEVYSLALFVSLLAVRQLVEWAVAEHGLKHALRAAFLTGLLCALDLPQALGVACVAVPAVLLKGGPVTRRVRALGISIPAFLVGGAALAYLPARAHAGANMWGDPTSWAGFWNYVSGAAYDANGGVGVEGLDFAARVSTVALHVALASGIAPLAGMALFGAGILRLPESTRRFAVAVAVAPLVALIPVGECAFDPSLPDHVAYLALGVTLLIVVGAVGFVLIPASGALRWLPFALVLGLGMNIPAFSEVRALPNADAPALETLAGAAVDGVPPRSLVVVASDFFCTSWLLAQAVDGARPDVAHLCSGLATEAWHWRSLGAHPVLSGNPSRGAGRTPTEQFTRGAIAQGIDHI
ncbi:MAG: DUF2723 domain-containing protein, partial [Myxococcales bacterium]|nr:DUF2723 domain-containing protein [Myxococcales bacterium]